MLYLIVRQSPTASALAVCLERLQLDDECAELERSERGVGEHA